MIKIITNRCQTWLYKKAECRLCVEACPVEGCIRFENNLVSVKAEDCIGCGICTTVCPTSALVMDNLSDSELLTRLNAAGIEGSTDNPSDMVFGCTLGKQEDKNKPSAFSLQPVISISLALQS